MRLPEPTQENLRSKAALKPSEFEEVLSDIKAWFEQTLNRCRSEDRERFHELEAERFHELEARLRDVHEAVIRLEGSRHGGHSSRELVTIRFFSLADEERAYRCLRQAGLTYQTLLFGFARVDQRALERLRAQGCLFQEGADYEEWTSEKGAKVRADYVKKLGIEYGFDADRGP